MLCEIRFVAKGEKYDKTVAKKVRECRDLAEALRWASVVAERSQPEDILSVRSVRVRVMVTDQVAEPLPPPSSPELIPSEPGRNKRRR